MIRSDCHCAHRTRRDGVSAPSRRAELILQFERVRRETQYTLRVCIQQQHRRVGWSGEQDLGKVGIAEQVNILIRREGIDQRGRVLTAGRH